MNEGFPATEKIISNTPENSQREFEQRVLALRPFVINVCSKALFSSGRSNMAEAIAHQALLQAIRKSDRYKEEGNLKGWLATIALNFVKEQFKKDKADPLEIKKREKFPVIIDSSPNIEESLIIKEQERLKAQLFKDAIKKLKPADQEILQMSFNEITAREIGGKLGIDPKAAVGRLSSARRRLARIMGQADDFKLKRTPKTIK